MELFSEIYSLYYRVIENLLRQAQEKPLNGGEIQKILSDGTFSESVFTIFPKLQSGDWPLLRRMESGYAPTCIPLKENPLTKLQQAWLHALLADPRINLFFDDTETEKLRAAFPNIEPLYHQDDFYLFDKAFDSDDYSSLEYQVHFRLFLSAIRQRAALSVQYEGGKGNRMSGVFWPYRLEYSQKDDKFRAYCYRKSSGRRMLYILNLGRVTAVALTNGAASDVPVLTNGASPAQFRQVVIEITRERNALERCMVHFAHFEKRTEYDESTDKYICTIRYNVMDETEVVIRVLSFGPTIKVLEPDGFINEIKVRVKKQSGLIVRNSVVQTQDEETRAVSQGKITENLLEGKFT